MNISMAIDMKRAALCCCVVVATLCVASADVQQQPPAMPPVKPLDVAKTDLPEGEALKAVEEIRIKVLKDKLPPLQARQGDEDSKEDALKAIKIKSFSVRIAFISKTLNVEEDTRISRKWFSELSGTLDLLSKVKEELEIAVDNKDKKAYSDYSERYLKGQKYFKDLLEKPVKLTDADMKRIREENEKIRRKIQAERMAEKRSSGK